MKNEEITSIYLIDIDTLKDYVVANDGNVYKKPFIGRTGRKYGYKLVRMQYPSRWRLAGEWYSMRQIKPRLTHNPKPEIINN